MPARGPSTQTLDERIDALSDDVRDLTKGLGDLRTEFAGFRGEICNELRWIKRIGGALAALVLTVVVGSWQVTWDAAAAATEVKQQGRRLDKVEERLDKIQVQVDKVDKRLDNVDNRLDNVEKRLDTMQQQLDVIISRLPAKAGG